VAAKSSSSFLAGKKMVALIALIYAVGAIASAVNIIINTEASTKTIEKILTTYSLKNEGEQAVDRYAEQHPFIGMFFASPVKKELELPSHDESAKALGSDIADLLKTVRLQSRVAAWWSCFLLILSLGYAVTIIAVERSFTARSVLFALTCISVIFFFIGILAPAMVIWTAPSIPMASGNLEFVVQHQVRGIAAIIWELFTGGHFIIGGFLFLFSILTPLTKATLTFFATACQSKELNFKIGQFLHTIGKWSMADVFVAAVLLALYALKFQQATKSVPCLGLYYFIGYCLLSMSTTELLTHSGIVAATASSKSEKKLGRGVISGLFAGLLCFTVLASTYTFQQYTMNTREHVEASSSPQKLNNADLVLPVHK
jgi:paraquat-inducible protein A